MRTADHKNTLLEFWIWLEVSVQQLWRKLWCFISLSVINLLSSIATAPLNLFLGIPWFYSVNAQISIRSFIIEIVDLSLGEEVCNVVGPELVFCQDHNLLIYPQKYMPQTIPHSLGPVKTTRDEADGFKSLEILSSDEIKDKLSDLRILFFSKSLA